LKSRSAYKNSIPRNWEKLRALQKSARVKIHPPQTGKRLWQETRYFRRVFAFRLIKRVAATTALATAAAARAKTI